MSESPPPSVISPLPAHPVTLGPRGAAAGEPDPWDAVAHSPLARTGKRVLRALERVRRFIEPLSARIFGPLLPPGDAVVAGFPDFETEADAVMSISHTQRAQKIVRAAVIVLVLLLAWSAIARVDEVTTGNGKVIPSRQLQVIQSLDGGVVSQILVREGDEVSAGQLLLRIDGTRATSSVRENTAQTFSLQAKLARLKALAEGTPFTPPQPAAGDAEQANVVEEERRLYESRMSEYSALVSISQQQLAQREQELTEVRAKRDSAARNLDLSQQELTKTRPLLATGAVSEVEVMRLERDVAHARGDLDQSTAQTARVQAAISEAQRKTQETQLSFRNDARKDLSDTLARLNALNEGAVALEDKVDKALVKSPVRGRVQRLLVNTLGGVVEPGKDIVEIVPLDDSLVLEARVAPKDIAFIAPGQDAQVKLTAYDSSSYGSLQAKVDNISPDTVVDDHGNAFYVVRVHTLKSSLGANLPIMPGMTAEVDILTGKKSVLSYLLEPILKVREHALHER